MKTDNRDIYEQIGHLFYAIAADQHVKPIEIGELKLLINKDWLPRNLGLDHMVSDAAHFIFLTLDVLQNSSISSKEAYSSFVKFYTLHKEVFTNELKQLILNTTSEITRVFAEKNSENKYLTELKSLLQTRAYSNI